MAEESEYWYVRNWDVVTGPFHIDELEAQRDRGALTWSQDVSQDGLYWLSASTILHGKSRPSARKRDPKQRGGMPIVVAGTVIAVASMGLWWSFGGDEAPPQTVEPVANAANVDPAPDPRIENPQPQPQPDPPPPPTPPPSPPPKPKPKPKPKPLSHAIRSAESVAEFSSAVGFVVCGLVYDSADGTKTELPSVTGTCFAISSEGYLLTNRHVIEDASKYRDSEERKAAEKKKKYKIEAQIWVFFKPPSAKLEKRPARIVFQTSPEDEIDLAVLKVDVGNQPLPCYFRLGPIGSSDELKGKSVWSLGYPSAARLPILGEKEARNSVEAGAKVEELFQEADFEYVPDQGIVNVVRKEPGKSRKTVEWILHGARISEGNSGGPLITREGTVVGINTLVQRVVKNGISNYFALGIAQIQEILIKNVPELQKVLDEPASDIKKE